MTANGSELATVLKVFAALLAIPVFMMGIVMPTMMLTGIGHVPGGNAGWMLAVVPGIALVFLAGIAYALFGDSRRLTGGREVSTDE